MTRGSRSPVTTLVVWSVVCCMGLVLQPESTAQPKPPGKANLMPDFPFDGVLTGNGVYVRSGPDTNYYPTTQLNRGQIVRVVGEEFGWYKIVPPSGSFSWVHKDYVQPTEKQMGRITGDRVAIRAGSPRTDRKTAVQMMARRGLEVKIVGQQGRWYKIEPPKGAYLYVSARYVKPAGVPVPKTVAEIGQPETASPATQPATLREPVAVRAPTTQPDKYQHFGPLAGRLRELDQQYQAQLKLPLSQQNWDRLVTQYQDIAQQTDVPLAATYARRRIEMIQYQQNLLAGYARLQELRRQFENTARMLVQKRAEMEIKQVKAPEVFAAKGVLKVSNIFASLLGPQRYRLVDPQTDRTLAYVEIPSNSDWDVTGFLGKFVGVQGKISYDKHLHINIVIPERIVVLRGPAEAAAGQGPATKPTGTAPAQ